MGGVLVRDVMTTGVAMVAADTSVCAAARLMASANVGEVVLVSDGQVCGVLTTGDITVRVVAAGLNPFMTPASEVATREVLSIAACEPVESAIRLMRQHGVKRLLAGDGKRSLVGILHAGDLFAGERPQLLHPAHIARPGAADESVLVAS